MKIDDILSFEEEGGNFLFSKKLRDGMAEFGNMDVRDALTSPDFFNQLLKTKGMSEKEREDFWKKFGRTKDGRQLL